MTQDLPRKGRSRNATADLLKGLAVLFMIQVHVMEQFGSTDSYCSLIGNISLFLGGPFCAPVFLAVMGYFLVNDRHTFSYFLKRGIYLFVGGVALNAARSAHLLIQIFAGKVNLSPLDYIFGADILTLAGLSLIIVGLLRMVFREAAFAWLITVLLVALVGPYLPGLTDSLPVSPYLTAFFWNTGAWSYFPVFPWLGYVLIGYAFRLLMKQPYFQEFIAKEHFRYFIMGIWVMILITVPWASGITRHLTGTGGYYHHGILFFGWALLFMAGYLWFAEWLQKHQGEQSFLRMVRWFGQHVTLVYVIQWLIIGNLAPVFYQSQNVFQMVLWFGSITTVTALLSIACLKIRGFFQGPHPG